MTTFILLTILWYTSSYLTHRSIDITLQNYQMPNITLIASFYHIQQEKKISNSTIFGTDHSSSLSKMLNWLDRTGMSRDAYHTSNDKKIFSSISHTTTCTMKSCSWYLECWNGNQHIFLWVVLKLANAYHSIE